MTYLTRAVSLVWLFVVNTGTCTLDSKNQCHTCTSYVVSAFGQHQRPSWKRPQLAAESIFTFHTVPTTCIYIYSRKKIPTKLVPLYVHTGPENQKGCNPKKTLTQINYYYFLLESSCLLIRVWEHWTWSSVNNYKTWVMWSWTNSYIFNNGNHFFFTYKKI